MAMSLIWTVMVGAAILCGLATGNGPAVAKGALDGAAAGGYLYMLTFQVGSGEWFWGLGLPIVILVTLIAELLTACIRHLPSSFLTNALYVVSAVGLLCLGLEILIDLYVTDLIALSWSAVVLTVVVCVDAMLITVLSRRRLRNEVRRRLHF